MGRSRRRSSLGDEYSLLVKKEEEDPGVERATEARTMRKRRKSWPSLETRKVLVGGKR